MAGIDELRAKAIASMKASGSLKPNKQGNPSNEDVPSCSGPPSILNTLVNTANPSPRQRQKKKQRSSNFSQWDSSARLSSSFCRTAFKNNNNGELPNKSPSPTWRGGSGSNSDLIISFSDGGDTDSGSEDSSSQRKVNFKENKEKAGRSIMKPTQTLYQKEQTLRHGVKSQRKIGPKRNMAGPPSGSLFTRAQGSSNVIRVENQIPAQLVNSSVKIIPHKEIGQISDINATEDKLRSLREQIALRENVLRRQKMSIPMNKDPELEGNVDMPSSLDGSSTNKEKNHLNHDGHQLEVSCNTVIEDMVRQQLWKKPTSEKTNEIDEQCGVLPHQLQVTEKKSSVININSPNQPESLEQGILGRDEILRLEELYDNELEEAREYRRKCELEELQALKAYRKTREALLTANSRCSFLYRKREMVSLLASKWLDSGENFSNTDSDPLAEVDRLMENNALVNGEKETIDINSKRMSVQPIQDLELETSLRNKLIAQKGSPLKCPAETYYMKGAIVNEIEMAGGDVKCRAPMSPAPPLPSEILRESHGNMKGFEDPGRKHQEDGGLHVDVNHSPIPITFLSIPSSLQIVGYHLNLFPMRAINYHKDPSGVRSKPNFDSQNVDFLNDPFWPICIFELRGKCNDDECPWQHLQSQNRQKSRPVISVNLSSDNQVETDSSIRQFLHQVTVSVPIYHVGSYLIEADALYYQSVLAFSPQQYWDVGFCASALLPLSIQRAFPSYIPFSCANDVHLTHSDDWSKPSLHFSCEADRIKKLNQGFNNPEQTLEIVLGLVNGRMNKKALKKEALSLLSRALEADPTSVNLWMVYLHIYYRNEKSIGQDDMFSYAVKFNQNSYELWHLYIGSRMNFEDRIIAYDEALSAFCQLARFHPIEESNHISSCILDLSLQMIHSFCMNGNVDDAISHISDLIHPEASSKNSYNTHFSDILSCLISSDRCILWICCLYLIIYKGLPEGIIQRLEFEKDLSFSIEWPPIHLSNEQKSRAFELLEKLVNIEKSTHFLAVNHVKCLAAIYGGLDSSSSSLLTEYLRMHPTCVELLVISFHREGSRLSFSVDLGFFKEALDKWSKDIPGSQRLWNQCAAFFLGQGKFKVVEKLMEHWFDRFIRNQEAKAGLILTMSSFFCHKQDLVFGLLNLGLYKMMQRNLEEARWAIDQALDFSTQEEYIHCVREHAVLSSLSLSSSAEIINLLTRYISDSRSNSLGDPFTRRSLTTLKKSNLRQMLVKFLGPVSSNFSLLNSVLETLYGPSLVPETFDEPKDMVDFVEHLMGITPSNHRLALSTCESLSKDGCYEGFASKSVMFWAGTLLVNAVFQCFPVASESVWLRAVNALSQLQNQSVLESFNKRAVSVHPFSLKLWQSYFRFSSENGKAAVQESARNRGFALI